MHADSELNPWPRMQEETPRDITGQHTPIQAALSTSSLLDELPERRPMTVILVSGAWRQFCYATA